MTSSQANASPLRQRMIDDMRMRQLAPKTQDTYQPGFTDSATLARLFTDGWRLDYRSQVVRDVHERCALRLRGTSRI
jgi:hypothetical protein